MTQRRGTYRIRVSSTKAADGGPAYYAISLPREVGYKLKGRLFRFEFTDEGMLFRPIPEGFQEEPVDLPAWAEETA